MFVESLPFFCRCQQVLLLVPQDGKSLKAVWANSVQQDVEAIHKRRKLHISTSMYWNEGELKIWNLCVSIASHEGHLNRGPIEKVKVTVLCHWRVELLIPGTFATMAPMYLLFIPNQWGLVIVLPFSVHPEIEIETSLMSTFSIWSSIS